MSEVVAAPALVNVRGVYVATQAALKHMKSGGRVITIGSAAGERDALAAFYDGDRMRILIAAVFYGLAVLNLM